MFSSRSDINKLVEFSKKANIKILFVQIYRANMSLFESQVGDSRLYELYRAKLSEDPLKLLIKTAHKSGIEVHAWLNLLSLSNNKNAKLLKKYGVSILTRNKKPKKGIQDYKIDSQYFLEPGDLRVRAELRNMVKEILLSYPDLDGIQFDYIRYPDEHPFYGYTEMNLSRFKKETGLEVFDEKNPKWQDWKRAQVNELLTDLVQTTRAIRPYIKVSATACAPFCRAYLEAFQDWPFWLNSGLVDFVTLMSYAPDLVDFEKEVLEAQKKVNNLKDLKIGVGAYKLVYSPDIFKKQMQFCSDSGTGACAVFHYGSLLKNRALLDYLINEEN